MFAKRDMNLNYSGIKKQINDEIKKISKSCGGINIAVQMAEPEYCILNFLQESIDSKALKWKCAEANSLDFNRIILCYELSMFYSDVRRLYNLSNIFSSHIFDTDSARSISGFTQTFIVHINNLMLEWADSNPELIKVLKTVNDVFGFKGRIEKEACELDYLRGKPELDCIMSVNLDIYMSILEILKHLDLIEYDIKAEYELAKAFSDKDSERLKFRIHSSLGRSTG